jgi:bifunctional non-homologous end joining protein LigD
MLAAPAGTLPADLGEWAIEPKWDGVRLMADVGARSVRLWTRNGNDKSAAFPEIVAALRALAAAGGSLVLDGEVVALDARGRALRFQALQGRLHGQGAGGGPARAAFVAFDCLMDGHRVLTGLPFVERRAALESRVPGWRNALVRRGESVRCGTAAARRLFARARRENWEGVLLKRLDSTYAAGRRTPDWRKVKLEREQEFVIGGWTLPTAGSARGHFGALLVGYHDDHGQLQYAGKVGTGFTHPMLALLAKKLAPLARATSPFANAPRVAGARWVRPALVAQVRYNELTEAGVLRQPSFLGLREDKAARDVRLEESGGAPAAVESGMRCAS